jgi:hypothetical protein
MDSVYIVLSVDHSHSFRVQLLPSMDYEGQAHWTGLSHGGQQFETYPNVTWNPEVHYRAQKRPPLVPVQSHINPVHIRKSNNFRKSDSTVTLTILRWNAFSDVLKATCDACCKM